MYSAKSNKKKPSTKIIISTVDKPLIIVISCIAIIGLILVFSASVSHGIQDYNDHLYFFKKQSKHFFLGIIAMLFFSKFQYKNFKVLSTPIALITLILLSLTHFMGDTIYGSTRWLFGFQPSELAKFSTLLLLADGLINAKSIGDEYFLKKIFWIILILVMILMQPDLSTTAIIAASCLALFFVGGAPIRLLFSVIITTLGLFSISIMQRAHQSDRIMGWIDPWADPFDKGYNLIQSLYAISSGGFWGVGIGNSKQKLLWLPLGHIDFIFAILAEELGFLGCIILLGLFFVFMLRGFYIAKKCPDRFGSLLAFGISFSILFQALVNICVAIGLLPVTGVTLPLISYGGTSILVTMSMIGILLNISRLKTRRINHGR